jgi:antitoxin (DNA-binding transcriptional repressor) of toxin-antitoxin stability system
MPLIITIATIPVAAIVAIDNNVFDMWIDCHNRRWRFDL